MSALVILGGLVMAAGGVCLLISLGLFLNQASQAAAPVMAAPSMAAPLAAGASATPALTPTQAPTGNPMRDKFIHAHPGQTLTVQHPQRGPLTGKILGTLRYAELWQRAKAPAEPWVPTGNQYTAHWLGNFLLYEWQDRFYLLDDYEPISDQDMQTRFLPYAKRFAQSDQTAHVAFDWPPAAWVIKDIGKFSVVEARGTGLRLNQGATGRFIHGDGADQRAIVVEDYQSGAGGQDTAWTGWAITWNDLIKI